MANLLVEVGNTAVKAAWSEGTTLGKTYRYQGEMRLDFIQNQYTDCASSISPSHIYQRAPGH